MNPTLRVAFGRPPPAVGQIMTLSAIGPAVAWQ
jgi:hypothetical protein